MFVALQQLRKLTGRTHRKKIIAWLREHKWKYAVDSNGTPQVAKAYFDSRMIIETKHDPNAPTSPDYSKLVRRTSVRSPGD